MLQGSSNKWEDGTVSAIPSKTSVSVELKSDGESFNVPHKGRIEISNPREMESGVDSDIDDDENNIVLEENRFALPQNCIRYQNGFLSNETILWIRDVLRKCEQEHFYFPSHLLLTELTKIRTTTSFAAKDSSNNAIPLTS